VPGSYAMQAYDAAMLINSAADGRPSGNLADRQAAALRAALKKADFTSLRGKLQASNTNGYPIQDFYTVKAAKRADGKFQTEIVEKVSRELRRHLRRPVPDAW
jgi:branched-chain amino acid transport system substrate-binding protein